MTAIAAASGSQDAHRWSWELRSLNGKSLDLRLRLPEGITGLEAALRARLAAALSRGNVTLTLKLHSDRAEGGFALDPAGLDAALAALARVEGRAGTQGLALAPTRAADILGLRGVLDTGGDPADAEALRAALLADFEGLLESFQGMRATEGATLAQLIAGQLDRIAELTEAAAQAAIDRAPRMDQSFRAALARVTDNAEAVDEARVAQELALLAVKADVTEEIDRLRAHVAAARDLLAAGSPVGRKLDFLAQEFNREANTLCAKAQYAPLTGIGLDLKTVIDQMREQVQNVE